MSEASELNSLVAQAREGNKEALDSLIEQLQGRIYNLALRMLWHPSDAEDATQEILLKIATHLQQFRQESTFTTWAYQIAKNHLLTTRKRRAETTPLSFAFIGDVLEDNEGERRQLYSASTEQDIIEQDLLVKDVQLRCTLGMLLCLDREQRLAFILSEVFEVSSAQGAAILEINEAAFRKRVSRARARLHQFMEPGCHLVNEARECNCVQQLRQSTSDEQKRLAALLATHPLETSALQPDESLRAQAYELAQLERIAAIFRSHPSFTTSDHFVASIKQLLAQKPMQILET